MTLRAKILALTVAALFIAGIVYLTYYFTRRQLTKADFPLLPQSTATLTATETKQPPEGQATSPETQSQLTLQLSAGFNLVSFGHRLAPSDCKNVFANLSSRQASALVQGKWQSCFADREWSVAPGEGYFVNSKNGENLKISVTATPVSTSERFSFNLAKGWSAIGNPFPKSLKLDLAKVEASFDSKTFTLKQAIENKNLSPLHRFNPITRAFEEVKDSDVIQANQGLIIQSAAKGTITFPGPGD